MSEQLHSEEQMLLTSTSNLESVREYVSSLRRILDTADAIDQEEDRGFDHEQSLKLDIAQCLIRDRISVVSSLIGRYAYEDPMGPTQAVLDLESIGSDLAELKSRLDVTREDTLDAVIELGGLHGRTNVSDSSTHPMFSK